MYYSHLISYKIDRNDGNCILYRKYIIPTRAYFKNEKWKLTTI